MKYSIPTKVQKAVSALLTKDGICRPQLRQAVEACAAGMSGGDRNAQELPPELAAFVRQVVMDPHQVTDRDFGRLIDAGYSEDAIFEIVLCAGMGAGLARFERGLRALKEAADAPARS